MAVKDFQINSRVRGILARHWIDTNLITAMTIRGVVFLQGRMKKITMIPGQEEVGEETLASMELEMRHIKGVRQIVYRLDDWRKDGGKFLRTEAKKKEEEKKRAERVAEEEKEWKRSDDSLNV